MIEMTFEISEKITNKLIDIALKENCGIDELVEEAILSHFKISLIDLNSDVNINKNSNIIYPYYVYVYLNPLVPGKFKYDEFEFDYQPIYVGKGCGDRHIQHLNDAKNKSLKLLIEVLKNKNKEPIILKLKENIQSYAAYKLESKLILAIGRSNLGKGPLLNNSGGIITDKPIPPTFDIETSIEAAEMLNILAAINKFKTLKQAANALNISERNLYRKIKYCNIKKVDGQYFCVMP